VWVTLITFGIATMIVLARVSPTPAAPYRPPAPVSSVNIGGGAAPPKTGLGIEVPPFVGQCASYDQTTGIVQGPLSCQNPQANVTIVKLLPSGTDPNGIFGCPNQSIGSTHNDYGGSICWALKSG
jgi:hypothetical protein